MKTMIPAIVITAMVAIEMVIAIRRRSLLLAIVAVFPPLVPLSFYVIEVMLQVAPPLWFKIACWANLVVGWVVMLREDMRNAECRFPNVPQ